MTDQPPDPRSFRVLDHTEDGRTRVQSRFDAEPAWLTQALIAELFQVSVPTINEHLKGLFEDGEVDRAATLRSFRRVRTKGSRHSKAIADEAELSEAATCKPYLQVHQEGTRRVAREVLHDDLPVILTVGYCVCSTREVQFPRDLAKNRPTRKNGKAEAES